MVFQHLRFSNFYVIDEFKQGQSFRCHPRCCPMEALRKIIKFIWNYLTAVRLNFMGMETRKKRRISPGPYAFRIFRYKLIRSENSNRVPKPRSGHRIVCDDKNMYSFGGYNPNFPNAGTLTDPVLVGSFPLLQELWKLNFATKRWTRFKNNDTLPMELASNAVIRQGDYLMVNV